MSEPVCRVVAASVCLVAIGCTPAGAPERAALRERLRQPASLSSDELGRFRDEIARSIEGRTFLKEGTEPLTAEERETVLGIIANPIGVFDEGRRERSGETFRILNAPGRSSSADVEAIRRLWIDIETFLPARFEFSHAFQGYGEYAFNLAAEDDDRR